MIRATRLTTALTTAQAAALLGLSPSQARRLARQGRIRGASKPGRDWLYTPPLEILHAAKGIA